MTTETLTAAAQAANLLADAVRQAQQTANKANHHILELAAALAEIAEAANAPKLPAGPLEPMLIRHQGEPKKVVTIKRSKGAHQ